MDNQTITRLEAEIGFLKIKSRIAALSTFPGLYVYPDEESARKASCRRIFTIKQGVTTKMDQFSIILEKAIAVADRHKMVPDDLDKYLANVAKAVKLFTSLSTYDPDDEDPQEG
jgi:hypothetical protein